MDYHIDDSASFSMYGDVELCHAWNAPATEDETKQAVVAESGEFIPGLAMSFAKETAPEQMGRLSSQQPILVSRISTACYVPTCLQLAIIAFLGRPFFFCC